MTKTLRKLFTTDFFIFPNKTTIHWLSGKKIYKAVERNKQKPFLHHPEFKVHTDQVNLTVFRKLMIISESLESKKFKKPHLK